MEAPIESAEDLARQTKIKYGRVASGSTESFFRDANVETLSRMWDFMQSANTFVKDNSDGVEKAIKEDGKHAFLMESNSIQYQIDGNCNLVQIGGLLDSKGYGIAFTPGSMYQTPFSSAILHMQRAGTLNAR